MSCCDRGESITICGPTSPLPFAASTIRTSRRSTARPRHRTNAKSYVPTNPTPGAHVNTPVVESRCEPIGSGASPALVRR